VLDRKLIEKAQAAIDRGRAGVKSRRRSTHTDRSRRRDAVGHRRENLRPCGSAARYDPSELQGHRGAGVRRLACARVTFDLEGEGNDYVGKGLSGGRIIVKPPHNSGIVRKNPSSVGNTVMYGAIEGECYFSAASPASASRCVTSGAIAVVEGAGDHCCEYMTGGIVVVLGKTGRNFAAGMSGGIAYVLDEAGDFDKLCNMAMVELEPVLSEEMINQNTYHHAGDLEAHGRVDVFQDLLDSDVERLHILVTRHAKLTGSKRAAEHSGELEELRAEIPQGDAGGIPPRAEGIESERGPPSRKSRSGRNKRYRDRHCERSEAIHQAISKTGLLRRSAPPQ